MDISLGIRYHLSRRPPMKKPVIFVLSILFLSIVASLSMSSESANAGELTISSPAFENNSPIPDTYTCKGRNISPPLLIGNIPASAKSLALVLEDPDAPSGIFVHWVMWNITPGTREISENSSPRGVQQGLNDFRKHGYIGPCPPSGTHRYFFKIYALDTLLRLQSGAAKKDLEKAMKGHIIDQASLTGLFQRR
jgi:Raf kinase inhibitor-like YbhB/YbcL family protein